MASLWAEQYRAWRMASAGASVLSLLDDDGRYRLKRFARDEWSEYRGPRGGRGWKNIATGKIEYGVDRPGAHETGAAGQGAEAAKSTVSQNLTNSGLRQVSRDGSGNLMFADGGPLPRHLNGLRLPPAWTGVMVDPTPGADLLAIGYDSKGRKQSVYSPNHKMAAAAEKFQRVASLSQRAEEILAKSRQKIRSADRREADLAVLLALIAETGIRPGSERDTGAAKQAYGATTLQARHVHLTPAGNVYLRFTGKRGVNLSIPVRDKDVADILSKKKRSALRPRTPLFKVSDSQLREYVQEVSGGDFKVKDFRTLKGTTVAAELVRNRKPAKSMKDYKKIVRDIAAKVASVLGNTPTIALQSYIDPTVFTKIQPAGGAVAMSLWRMDAQGKGRWITIGGKPNEEKGVEHEGGTPVLIDGEGEIRKGPAALKGKKLNPKSAPGPVVTDPKQPDAGDEPEAKQDEITDDDLKYISLDLYHGSYKAENGETHKVISQKGWHPETASWHFRYAEVVDGDEEQEVVAATPWRSKIGDAIDDAKEMVAKVSPAKADTKPKAVTFINPYTAAQFWKDPSGYIHKAFIQHGVQDGASVYRPYSENASTHEADWEYDWMPSFTAASTDMSIAMAKATIGVAADKPAKPKVDKSTIEDVTTKEYDSPTTGGKVMVTLQKAKMSDGSEIWRYRAYHADTKKLYKSGSWVATQTKAKTNANKFAAKDGFIPPGSKPAEPAESKDADQQSDNFVPSSMTTFVNAYVKWDDDGGGHTIDIVQGFDSISNETRYRFVAYAVDASGATTVEHEGEWRSGADAAGADAKQYEKDSKLSPAKSDDPNKNWQPSYTQLHAKVGEWSHGDTTVNSWIERGVKDSDTKYRHHANNYEGAEIVGPWRDDIKQATADAVESVSKHKGNLKEAYKSNPAPIDPASVKNVASYQWVGQLSSGDSISVQSGVAPGNGVGADPLVYRWHIYDSHSGKEIKNGEWSYDLEDTTKQAEELESSANSYLLIKKTQQATGGGSSGSSGSSGSKIDPASVKWQGTSLYNAASGKVGNDYLSAAIEWGLQGGKKVWRYKATTNYDSSNAETGEWRESMEAATNDAKKFVSDKQASYNAGRLKEVQPNEVTEDSTVEYPDKAKSADGTIYGVRIHGGKLADGTQVHSVSTVATVNGQKIGKTGKWYVMDVDKAHEMAKKYIDSLGGPSQIDSTPTPKAAEHKPGDPRYGRWQPFIDSQGRKAWKDVGSSYVAYQDERPAEDWAIFPALGETVTMPGGKEGPVVGWGKYGTWYKGGAAPVAYKTIGDKSYNQGKVVVEEEVPEKIGDATPEEIAKARDEYRAHVKSVSDSISKLPLKTMKKEHPASKYGHWSPEAKLWTTALDKKEASAVSEWTGSSGAIRRTQSGIPQPRATDADREADLKRVAAWESAMNKAPHYKGTIYRGIALEADAASRLLDAAKVGSVIGVRADSSATKSTVFVRNWIKDKGGQRFIFRVNAKTGVDLASRGLGGGSEYEVIMRKGRYKVTGLSKNKLGGEMAVIIDVDELEGDEFRMAIAH